MASFNLKSPSAIRLEHLRDYHTFGRREDSVDTFLEHSYVSKIHAVIEWREPDWLLKDVSKNGLKLNGKVIPIQKQITLNIGDTIDFAGVGDVILTIKSLDPPKSMLISQDSSASVIELAENILLPDETSPELAVYRCQDRQQWFVENMRDGFESGPYANGDSIEIKGEAWSFLLVSDNDATQEFNPAQPSLDDIVFRFDLSQDEENTNLTLVKGGLEVDLGERSHHYLLVHLLRHRATEASGLGWLNNQLLLKELGLEEAHMNIQIFRARKQLAEALPETSGQSKFIERRRGALRVNIFQYEIYKEGQREV